MIQKENKSFLLLNVAIKIKFATVVQRSREKKSFLLQFLFAWPGSGFGCNDKPMPHKFRLFQIAFKIKLNPNQNNMLKVFNQSPKTMLYVLEYRADQMSLRNLWSHIIISMCSTRIDKTILQGYKNLKY